MGIWRELPGCWDAFTRTDEEQLILIQWQEDIQVKFLTCNWWSLLISTKMDQKCNEDFKYHPPMLWCLMAWRCLVVWNPIGWREYGLPNPWYRWILLGIQVEYPFFLMLKWQETNFLPEAVNREFLVTHLWSFLVKGILTSPTYHILIQPALAAKNRRLLHPFFRSGILSPENKVDFGLGEMESFLPSFQNELNIYGES